MRHFLDELLEAGLSLPTVSLVDDLRAVAKVLPPSLGVSNPEALGVLSALVAVAEHGPELIDAAKQGPQAVADFYHEKISAEARAAGKPEPSKGAPVESAPAGGAPASAVPAGGPDIERLVQDGVAKALAALGIQAAAAERSDTSEAVKLPDEPAATEQHHGIFGRFGA